MRIAITGASGYLGRALVRQLVASHEICASARDHSDAALIPGGTRVVEVGDISPEIDWRPLLEGCEAVIHLAARAHITQERDSDPLHAFRAVNTAGSQRLAEQAKACKVRRFVLVSSIGVHGRGQGLAPDPAAITETSPIEPEDDYAISKAEAERATQEVFGDDWVCVRPALVAGPGAPGNLRRLRNWVARGVPLPLASSRGRRSFVSLDRLVSLLELAATHPEAQGPYVAADREPMTTPQVIRAIAAGMQKSAPLLPMPPGAVVGLAGLVGKRRLALQLFGSLVVDASRAEAQLGWQRAANSSAALEQLGSVPS